jgi:hypothetical protein
MAGMAYKSKRLVSDALHFEKHLLAAAVVEFRGAAAGVAGNSLSGFKGSVISQKIRDPGCPERVRRIVRRTKFPTSTFLPKPISCPLPARAVFLLVPVFAVLAAG